MDYLCVKCSKEVGDDRPYTFFEGELMCIKCFRINENSSGAGIILDKICDVKKVEGGLVRISLVDSFKDGKHDPDIHVTLVLGLPSKVFYAIIRELKFFGLKYDGDNKFWFYQDCNPKFVEYLEDFVSGLDIAVELAGLGPQTPNLNDIKRTESEKLGEIQNWIITNKDSDKEVFRPELAKKISEYDLNVTAILKKLEEEGLISASEDIIGAWRVLK